MSRLVLFLFAILAIFSVHAGELSRSCPPNEVWNECGTACPPTCEKPLPGPCTLQCKPGCVCERGLLRNQMGRCVQPSKCPSRSE